MNNLLSDFDIMLPQNQSKKEHTQNSHSSSVALLLMGSLVKIFIHISLSRFFFLFLFRLFVVWIKCLTVHKADRKKNLWKEQKKENLGKKMPEKERINKF